jgi:hypothetical protein
MKKVLYFTVSNGKAEKLVGRNEKDTVAYEYDDEKHKDVEAKHLIMQKDGLHDTRSSIHA